MADPSDKPDQDPQEPEPQTPPEDEGEPSTTPEGDPAAEAAKWKALARKHEQRAKAGAAAERRLAELEEADKTELQRAQDTAQTEKARADAAEGRALRAEVAARKGLSASQSKRLQGTTEEELEADADELLAAFQPHEQESPPNGGKPPGQPVPKLKPGAVPDAGATETDPRKLAEQISRRSF